MSVDANSRLPQKMYYSAKSFVYLFQYTVYKSNIL